MFLILCEIAESRLDWRSLWTNDIEEADEMRFKDLLYCKISKRRQNYFMFF